MLVGCEDGVSDGADVGDKLGTLEGDWLGAADGVDEGDTLGLLVG